MEWFKLPDERKKHGEVPSFDILLNRMEELTKRFSEA